MVNREQIINGAARWFDSELMPQIPQSGVKRILTGTAIAVILKRANYIIDSFSSSTFAKYLRLSDENGNMEIDDIYEELKHHIPDKGVAIDIPLVGKLTMRRDDLDSLYRFIKEA